MRIACALLLLSMLGYATGTACATEFPYTAFVRGNDVYLRSGPGSDYYRTAKVKGGQKVEVYRHDPGGWYAIRPTEGSFSWIAASQIQLLEGNLAEVIEDRTAAYVGSKISDARDERQVLLDKGEYIEVIGEKEIVKSGNSETWYKIAPPSGEFRWISRDDLNRVGWVGDQSPVHLTGEDAESANSGEQVRFAGGSFDGPADQDGDQANRPRRLSTTDRLDLELSMIVAEPYAQWNFADIRGRAETDLKNAQTALDRARARLVLDEIARFESLKRQYAAADPVNHLPTTPSTPSPATPPSTISAASSTPTITTPTSDPNIDAPANLSSYDGVGRLTPVVSKRPGAPRFALTDMKGGVLMFVTPAYGVDLQSHVGKVVGLSGTRGFMPKLRKTHLSASEVQRLEPTALLAVRPIR